VDDLVVVEPVAVEAERCAPRDQAHRDDQAAVDQARPVDAARNDYNFSPGRYVAGTSKDDVLPLEEAVVRLREAEEERAAADREFHTVLLSLGLLEEADA